MSNKIAAEAKGLAMDRKRLDILETNKKFTSQDLDYLRKHPLTFKKLGVKSYFNQ